MILTLFASFLIINFSQAQTHTLDSTYGLRKITEIKMLGYITGFADLNHNGKLDIVGLGSRVPDGDYHIKIFERENDTTYNEVYVGKVVWDEFPEWVGDSDGDGLYEIMVSRYYKMGDTVARKLILYESIDTFSFPDTTNVIWSFVRGGYNYNPIYCEDLDKDGKREIIFCDNDATSQTILIWEAQSNNNYELVSMIRIYGWPEVSNLSFGDVDGDKRKEIIISDERGGIRIFENTGDDSYELIWTGNTGVYNSYASAFLGDTDGDGKNEFIVGGNNPGLYHQLNVYEAIVDNSYEKIWEDIIYDFPYGVKEIISSNIDGNQQLEFAFWNTRYTWFYQAYQNNQYRCILNFKGGYSLKTLDLDNDKKDEILFGWGYDTPIHKILIFKYDSLITSVDDNKENMFSNFILFQNFPNPFNKQTEVTYEINKTLDIELKVYDVLGNEIITLAEGKKNAGKYKVIWNGNDSRGNDVSSGIYLIKLKNSGFTKLVKAILLK